MTATKSLHAQTRSGTVRIHDPLTPEGSGPSPSDVRRSGKDATGTAEYIASMTAKLAGMAGIAKLDMLTYFLNMARLEAEFHMRRRK